MSPITVRKLDLAGKELFAYAGNVLARTPNSVTVEAFFSRYDRLDLGYTVFERGDRFVEFFYADRWYNVFEVHAVGTDKLRGWYCNVTRPAIIEDARVSAVDLALDLWINSDGSARVLDEEEFVGLLLAPAEREAARAALDELRMLASKRAEPFAAV